MASGSPRPTWSHADHDEKIAYSRCLACSVKVHDRAGFLIPPPRRPYEKHQHYARRRRRDQPGRRRPRVQGLLRVETYGTVDELNSSLGFARSICEDAEIAAFTKGVQQDLFKIGSSLATPPGESQSRRSSSLRSWSIG